MKRLMIYDNGGKTADRYSVYVLSNYVGWHWFTMSDKAMSPDGVNQYGGVVWAFTPGPDEKRVALKNLPLEVRKAVAIRRKMEAR